MLKQQNLLDLFITNSPKFFMAFTAERSQTNNWQCFIIPLFGCRAKSNWLFDVPWGIRKLLNWVSKEYGQPDIVVTENGWSDDGSSLVDDSRIKYYSGYITEMSKGNSL